MNVVVCMKDSSLVEIMQKKEDLEVFFINNVDDIAFSEFDLVIIDISLCSGKLDVVKNQSNKTVFVISDITEEIIDKIIDLYKVGEYPFRYTFSGKEYVVDLHDIVYFESRHKIVRGYNEAGAFIRFYGKLDEVQKKVDDFVFFLRVNKSHLVNYNYCKIGKDRVTVIQKEIQISRTYKKAFQERLKLIKNM